MVTRAIPHVLHGHRRNRSKRRCVGRNDERARRGHELLFDGPAVDGRIAEQPDGGRRRHWKQPVGCLHHAAANVERRCDNPVGAKPLQPEHGADDVDDRVHCTNLVQVHLVDGHLVNRRLSLCEPLEQELGTVAAGRRQGRRVDQGEDFRQAPMRMPVAWFVNMRMAVLVAVLVIMTIRGVMIVVVAPIAMIVVVDRELRSRHARPQDTIGVHVIAGHGKTAQRALELVERQTRVEERAQHHVAGNAREAVEVQHPTHRCPIS